MNVGNREVDIHHSGLSHSERARTVPNMFSKFKKQFEPLIAIIAQPFLSWNPSILTILSLVFALFFFIGIIEKMYLLSIISLFGFLFDAIDGYVARSQHKVTAFGGFLDSVIDRIADFLFITSFGFGNLVPWGLVVFVLFTSFLISYMRSRGDLAFNLGHAPAEGLMQRTERIILIYLAFLLFLVISNFTIGSLSLLTCIFALLAILNTYTIFQRFLFFTSVNE